MRVRVCLYVCVCLPHYFSLSSSQSTSPLPNRKQILICTASSFFLLLNYVHVVLYNTYIDGKRWGKKFVYPAEQNPCPVEVSDIQGRSFSHHRLSAMVETANDWKVHPAHSTALKSAHEDYLFPSAGDRK